MSPADQNWARAYARQALSDLGVREILARSDAERCHQLHFLQMAAEKTCKAHLSSMSGNQDVRRTHAIIAKVLPIVARAFYTQANDRNKIPSWQIARIKKFSLEIELLAPARDAGDARKDNSEYPWLDAQGRVQTPCEYTFPNLDDNGRLITLMVRLIRAAAETYAS